MHPTRWRGGFIKQMKIKSSSPPSPSELQNVNLFKQIISVQLNLPQEKVRKSQEVFDNQSIFQIKVTKKYSTAMCYTYILCMCDVIIIMFIQLFTVSVKLFMIADQAAFFPTDND